MNRKALSGYRCLIDLSHAIYNQAIKRNHIAGLYNNFILKFNLVYIYKDLFAVFSHLPYLIHVKRHGTGKISNRLLSRPFIHQISDTEQEYNTSRSIKISTKHRYCYAGCIKHRYCKLSFEQALRSLYYIWNRLDCCDHASQRYRE